MCCVHGRQLLWSNIKTFSAIMFFIHLQSFAFILYFFKKIIKSRILFRKGFYWKKASNTGSVNFLWKFTDQHVIVLCFTDIWQRLLLDIVFSRTYDNGRWAKIPQSLLISFDLKTRNSPRQGALISIMSEKWIDAPKYDFPFAFSSPSYRCILWESGFKYISQ